MTLNIGIGSKEQKDLRWMKSDFIEIYDPEYLKAAQEWLETNHRRTCLLRSLAEMVGVSQDDEVEHDA